MTVTIAAKHEILTSGDENENGACERLCEPCGIHDHTESLLENLTEQTLYKETTVTKHENGVIEESVEEIYYEKARVLLHFDDAPEHLRHNHYIRTGYRGLLPTELCLESIFWWTNETINIWSHMFGLVLFVSLTIWDLMILKIEAPLSDKILVGAVLICFQACMALSSLYHTFSCRSEEDCHLFLAYDLFGIALSLMAIYASGIYYAFWCDQELQTFYMSSVTLIFVIAMTLQLPRFQVNPNIKMIVFVAWAAYGVVPTLHWAVKLGGFENPVVRLLLPRVFGMYVISGAAFFIYVAKVPERFFAGRFDFIGHSHQWWHLFVVGALYYWHNTGMLYVDYRLNHACANSMRLP